jgi:DNA repair exonuclease SbcCD ATPase subunit
MQDMAELERRIAAALHRIGEGIETLTSAATAAPSALPSQDHAADAERIQHLQEALSAERHTVAALREQLEAQAVQAPAPAPEPNAAPDEDRTELLNRIEKMTAQLDVQGLEIHRMRKTVVQLRENLRGLRRAQTANLADPEQINRAMMAELEAIRVTRLSEVAEMDEILTELTPLIKEDRLDA